MNYKILFHAYIDGRKQNLDAVIQSVNEPKLTDTAVIRAVMSALSETVEVDDPVFTIEFHIETILPLV